MQIRSRVQIFRAMTWAQRRVYYGARVERLARLLAVALCAPLYYPLALVLAAAGYRVIRTRPGSHKRIGHLAMEMQFYVKAGLVGLRPSYKAFLLGPRRSVANAFFRDLWRQHMTVVANPFLELVLMPLAWMKPAVYKTYPLDSELSLPDGRTVKGLPAYDEAYIGYYRKLGTRPILSIPSQFEARGWRTLTAMGLRDGGWYAALHVREGGFIAGKHLAARNDDISDYLPAVREVTARGGLVVRLGNPTMTPLPPLPGVIDYVFTPARSEWMDIFLLANCRFFFGSDSGPCMVPGLFGRPCAIANIVQMGSGFWQPYDLFTKKLIRSKSDGRLLTFPEVMLGDLRDVLTPAEFDAAGVEWVHNTPTEIASLVREMLDRMDGTVEYSAEDEKLQEMFRALLMARSTRYTFGSEARIGRDFARMHRNLFANLQAGAAPDSPGSSYTVSGTPLR